ncbi:hypothetical protein QUA54_29680 [Microcoleus sp. MOSTC5]|uniref:hypothetical protein n=1 Tax=Microcoleus sp. MOSTC5 TaxID=3055378 RepID=UPI002FD39E4C
MKFLAAKFAQVNANISETQAQIAALQTKLSEFQDYHQYLLLVEQACESVLAQMETALAMLNDVDPTQIATFKAAVELKFNSEAIDIFEPTASTEAATPEPNTDTESEVSIEQEVEPVINTQLETDAINIIEPVSALTEPFAPRLTAPTALETPVECDCEPAINVEIMNATDEQSEAAPEIMNATDEQSEAAPEVMNSTDEQSEATPEIMNSTDEQSEATLEAMPTPDRIVRRYSRK